MCCFWSLQDNSSPSSRASGSRWLDNSLQWEIYCIDPAWNYSSNDCSWQQMHHKFLKSCSLLPFYNKSVIFCFLRIKLYKAHCTLLQGAVVWFHVGQIVKRTKVKAYLLHIRKNPRKSEDCFLTLIPYIKELQWHWGTKIQFHISCDSEFSLFWKGSRKHMLQPPSEHHTTTDFQTASILVSFYSNPYPAACARC